MPYGTPVPPPSQPCPSSPLVAGPTPVPPHPFPPQFNLAAVRLPSSQSLRPHTFRPPLRSNQPQVRQPPPHHFPPYLPCVPHRHLIRNKPQHFLLPRVEILLHSIRSTNNPLRGITPTHLTTTDFIVLRLSTTSIQSLTSWINIAKRTLSRSATTYQYFIGKTTPELVGSKTPHQLPVMVAHLPMDFALLPLHLVPIQPQILLHSHLFPCTTTNPNPPPSSLLPYLIHTPRTVLPLLLTRHSHNS